MKALIITSLAITLPLLLASCYSTGYPYGGGYSSYGSGYHGGAHYPAPAVVHDNHYGGGSHYVAPRSGHYGARSVSGHSHYQDPHHGTTSHSHDAAGHRTDSHGHHVDKHGHHKQVDEHDHH